jgi:SWI/SNF-related matrix-associated actin-dependent regulator 1 of chromatin subfamily A
MGFASSNSSVTEQEEGPPRKRLNRGFVEDTSDSLDVLSSPEVRRGTHRRRIVSGNTDIMSITSDDSLPDTHSLTSTSTSRLTKHAPTSSSSPNTANDEAKFTRFKYTMPQESPTRVRAAWEQANGDIKKATALLYDQGWAPLPSSSANGKIQLEAMGRVQELDEESRARRAATKEKGKKSMIYANRSNLENKIHVVSTPPSSKRPLEVIPVSPETPIIRPQRKRLKQVIKSDSEEEASAEEQNIRSHSGMSDAMRALNYFNTSDAEALQELTGATFLHLQRPAP